YGLMDVRGDGMDSVTAEMPVPQDIVDRLREVSRQLGVSAATVLHVAWARVLSTLSGRDDVVFGTVLFGRMNAGAGADRVVGPFINTLPVRVRTGRVGVREAVEDMRRQLAALLEHEHAPLAVAQQASGVAENTPLFTSLFNYRHIAQGPDGPDAEATRAPEGIRTVYARERTNYPLSVSVNDLDVAGLSLSVEVVDSLDPHAVGQLLCVAVQNVVAALSGPDVPLFAIGLLDGEQVVCGPVLEVPAGTVVDVFEAQAARTPAVTALVCGAVSLSFAEVNARANRLARHLVRAGVGPERVVAVSLPRSVDSMVGLLAVWKAGGVYLPVDPALPSERTALLLSDADPAFVLTEAVMASLVLAELSGGDLTDADRRAPLLPRNSAYVIYTSGSTGRPKGVVVEHRQMLNLLVN
ncbi:AMP-binding protein, partial [Micromonospora aurantiaca]|uniref:AMP-binding protein n=1 Tax=Micromonospora aurantiaca (nom. illeg.) TaxID=47850 RepID=UPI0033BF0BE0